MFLMLVAYLLTSRCVAWETPCLLSMVSQQLSDSPSAGRELLNAPVLWLTKAE